MAFELTIDHPYKYVLNYVKTFRGNQTDKQTKEVAQVRACMHDDDVASFFMERQGYLEFC